MTTQTIQSRKASVTLDPCYVRLSADERFIVDQLMGWHRLHGKSDSSFKLTRCHEVSQAGDWISDIYTVYVTKIGEYEPSFKITRIVDRQDSKSFYGVDIRHDDTFWSFYSHELYGVTNAIADYYPDGLTVSARNEFLFERFV